jgi:NAD(P)-dependent dehydrogenase (short-subunit alcohol dehydrogenase family)
MGMGRFEEKVVVITGGAIGFGRSFARAFVAEGAAVVIADIDGEGGERTASELREAGGRAIAVRCDVADEAQVEAAVATTVAELGGVDVLINNAGLHLMRYNQPFSVMPRSDLRALFDVNVFGVVNCTTACRASMAERGGGAVLNISSIAGYLNPTPYGVSKLAVRGLTIALAQELARDDIRVNAVAPGLMATENAVDDLPQAMVDEFVGRLQLVHRLGQMSDITAAVLYLCSDEASFVTGETLKVSGGYPLLI